MPIDPALQALFDSPEHKAAVAQARAERSAAAKLEREAKAAKKADGLARMAAPGLKEKARVDKRRRAERVKKARKRGRVIYLGRDAALAALRWAYARRCDGMNQSAKLHPGKFKTVKPTYGERRTWGGRLLTQVCREVGERLSMLTDAKLGEVHPSAIAQGKVKRSANFWREVTRGIFECYRKIGKEPPASDLQDQLGFKLTGKPIKPRAKKSQTPIAPVTEVPTP